MRIHSIGRVLRLLAMVGVLTAACEDSTGPATGVVEIVVTGTAVDPNALVGLSVVVSGGTGALSNSIGFDARAGFAAVAAGQYRVQLVGLLASCMTTDNPRTIDVLAGRITSVVFTITCPAHPILLQLVASTTGVDLDADGYVVTVTGPHSYFETTVRVPANGSVPVQDPSPTAGEYVLTFDDVASNCSVAGGNQRTVSVVADSTTIARFQVNCTPAKPDTLAVTVATTGDNPDADGYGLYLVSPLGHSRATFELPVNGTVILVGLDRRVYEASVFGIASNCSVPPTQTFSLPETKRLEFSISCVGGAGNLRVTTGTTGDDLDADGYMVVVDGVPRGRVGIIDTMSVTHLRVGVHDMWLTDIAPNCRIVGNATTRRFTLDDGATMDVFFEVACIARSLRVTTTTTGVDIDPDGYLLRISYSDFYYDYSWTTPLPANGVVLIPIYRGIYTLELLDVASNCSSTNPGKRTVDFPIQSSIGYEVVCSPLSPGESRPPAPDDSGPFVPGIIGSGWNSEYSLHSRGRAGRR